MCCCNGVTRTSQPVPVSSLWTADCAATAEPRPTQPPTPGWPPMSQQPPDSLFSSSHAIHATLFVPSFAPLCWSDCLRVACLRDAREGGAGHAMACARPDAVDTVDTHHRARPHEVHSKPPPDARPLASKPKACATGETSQRRKRRRIGTDFGDAWGSEQERDRGEKRIK